MFPRLLKLSSLCVVAMTHLPDATIGQELLVRYTFDEPSGPALDSGSDPKANGMLGADARRTTITPGGASPFALDLSAPGLASFLNAGDPAKVDTLESFTLTSWLYLDGLNADQGGSGNVRLLAKQGGGPDFNGISWNINNPNAGERAIDNFTTGLFIGGESGFSFARASEDVGAGNEWAFLAVTYDGLGDTDNIDFFYGAEDLEVDFVGEPGSAISGTVASTAGEADFGIGFTDAAPDVDFAAVGFQDDVRVYNGVLTLEQLEAVRLENLQIAPRLACDFDNDGACLAVDANALTAVGNLVEGIPLDASNEIFNLAEDTIINSADLAAFLSIAAAENGFPSPYLQGDANLDGNVDFEDFLANSSSFGKIVEFGVSDPDIVWSTGDFDGDNTIGFPDFLFVSVNFGRSSNEVAAVPEPVAQGLLLTGMLLLSVLRTGSRRVASHARRATPV